MLGYVFAIFSTDPLRQLTLLSPLILISILMLALATLILRRRVKLNRQLIGQFIIITLLSYAVFILMTALLSVTHTSYGAVQPVIVVFGVLYSFSLGIGLLFFAVLFWFKWARRRWRWSAGVYAVAHLSLLGLLFYGFYIEPFSVEITNTTIKEAKLPAGTPPIKIVLISDIHMERWTRREDDVLAKIKALDPDLVVISGDHMNIDFYDEQAYADLHRFFNGLNARYGVFAVGGVVDFMDDTLKVTEGTPVKLLQNETITVNIHGQPIELVGVKSNRLNDEEVLANLVSTVPTERLKLLLYHTPDIAPTATEAGVDLYLAGHTHGGQIALPFYGAVFTASNFGRTYAAGLYDLSGAANTKMYVTRGIGFEGNNTPRARLFAPPEISVITLVEDRK